jgi:alkaline phosphatase D
MPTAPTDRLRFERALRRRADRRRLLLAAGAGFAALSLPGRPTRLVGAQTPQATPASASFGGYPFTLGVASGDPLPDGVVLWTRLAPAPLDPDGGMAGVGATEVRWEVAADEGFGTVLQTGAATADPALGHAVHVDAVGLEPGRDYFYRFLAGGEVSPVGRTRTAPAANAPLDRLRFAFTSCQDWLTGHYTAYRHLAQEDLDLVFFLGDYIYEDAYGPDGDGTFPVPGREHTAPEVLTIEDYRVRHALHKSDPHLQAAHAAVPWVATWDDHEVDNDYAGDHDEAGTPPEEFLARKAAGYQTFYEHLPLRPTSMPVGPSMRLYRRFAFGDLAEFAVLDGRQYRTDHPCGAGEQDRCPAAVDPNTTMLGPEQERWLLAGLDASAARWNVIAQQTLMAELEHTPGPGEIFWTDAWDGYPAARNRILGHVMSRGIGNPVVLTGDWHSTFVNDLKADFADPDSPTIATEFVVTAITTGGDDNGYDDYYGPMVPNNPHIRFFDGDGRGYMRVEVTPERWQTDVLMVETVLDPEAGISTVASFVVEDGRPGAQPA